MLAVLSAFCLIAQPAAARISDLDQLTQGVRAVARPGLPGCVDALDDRALVFLASPSGEPVAAAGRQGNGRVVAFGHNGYLSPDVQATGDTGRLMANAVRWASGGKSRPRVGVLANDVSRAFGDRIGVPVEVVGEANLDASGIDVLVLTRASQPESVSRFVARGGGVIAGATPWGWMQLNPGRRLSDDFPLNQVLHRAGLTFADGTAEAVNPVSALEAGDRLHAGRLLATMAAGVNADRILQAFRAVPDTHPFSASVRSRVAQAPTVAPTDATPIRSSDALARLAIAVRAVDRQRGRPAPAVELGDFPGAVPDRAARVRETLTLDLSRAQWVGTGLYAAPGERIRVDVPEAWASKGLQVQIGAHSDTIWHLRDWKRHPEVMVRVPISAVRTEASSPFGGLVYVVVPRNEASSPAKVEFHNVVRAPRYVHGKTTRAQWARIKDAPAPWAEFESNKLILTVPSDAARTVEDPVALMNLWDRTLDLFAELGQKPLPSRPERIVADRQISAGYMHAGYPIMTHLDAVPLSLSVKQLTTDGSWGHWHELGHNHQQGWWTFDGTVEVTCNLFTMFAYERIAKREPGWRVRELKAKAAAHVQAGAPFDKWKSDPFLALTMYTQLLDAFGWDAYKRVFKSYLDDPESKRPRNDAEKRDQWMVRFSRVTGRNLGPFFQAWGVPTSAAARESIADLPEWYPADFPRPAR